MALVHGGPSMSKYFPVKTSNSTSQPPFLWDFCLSSPIYNYFPVKIGKNRSTISWFVFLIQKNCRCSTAHIGLTEGIASIFLPKKHWPRTGGWFHPQFPRFVVHTVDGSEILHQLIGCLSYKVLYIPGGAGFLPSTVFQYFHQILAKCHSRVVNFWGKTDSTPLPPVSPFSWLFLFLSSTLLSCLVSDSSHLCCSYYRIVVKFDC